MKSAPSKYTHRKPSFIESVKKLIDDGTMRLHHVKDLDTKTIILLSGKVLQECDNKPRESLDKFMNCEVYQDFDYLVIIDLIKEVE